jgi:hypothetical protein
MDGIIDLGYVPLYCLRLRTFQLKVQNNLSITKQETKEFKEIWKNKKFKWDSYLIVYCH